MGFRVISACSEAAVGWVSHSSLILMICFMFLSGDASPGHMKVSDTGGIAVPAQYRR